MNANIRVYQRSSAAKLPTHTMKYDTDHDGKSKTALAADQEHYPEQHEVKNSDFIAPGHLSHDEIAARAHELWQARGHQHGSADQDWLEAEAELRANRDSHNVLQSSANKGGSVQHQ
jgi:hypothetical protein